MSAGRPEPVSSCFQLSGEIERPSGLNSVALEEERETSRKGLGVGKARSCLMSSPPTRPTPTTATRNVFVVDAMLRAMVVWYAEVMEKVDGGLLRLLTVAPLSSIESSSYLSPSARHPHSRAELVFDFLLNEHGHFPGHRP